MKLRNGFVSNSSSSSFIVLVEDAELLKCENCKKLLKSLFNIEKARDFVVSQWCYSSWQNYLVENKEYNSSSLLTRAVEDNLDIMCAEVEYGEENIYDKVLEILDLKYEEI